MKDYRKRNVGGAAGVNRGGRKPLAVSGNRAKQAQAKQMKQRSGDRQLRGLKSASKEAGNMAKSGNLQGARAMGKAISSKARKPAVTAAIQRERNVARNSAGAKPKSGFMGLTARSPATPLKAGSSPTAAKAVAKPKSAKSVATKVTPTPAKPTKVVGYAKGGMAKGKKKGC